MSIKFEKVNYTYSLNTPFKYVALKEIDLDITPNKITAIIGATGSGKSTLVQHLNALLIPTGGTVTVFERMISSLEKPKKLKDLRKKVGLVFQFPEYQLFEETVEKDICFGPKNFNMEDAEKRALDCLKLVSLDPNIKQKSPLDLSGGQKRRVAIAGILAMDPDVLVLDEPTAGLDPKGAKDMMNLFQSINQTMKKTIIIVTHDMEHVLNYCDEVVVMDKGRVRGKYLVSDFFKDTSFLKELNILPPSVIRFKEELNACGFSIDEKVEDIQSLANAIVKVVL
ncbi:energy-coupling factor transporter ATPase [Erysipelotrichaceae bacterium OH741_COT-311]|nr:energy-coupling factor transporter ATPase [Erysipelotrichaceae bacterium OH741_COT-311]